MGVTPEEVRRVAGMARLDLGENELTVMTDQLNTILDHADELAAVDAAGAEPMAAPAERAPLRPDRPGADPLASDPGSGAPGWEAGFFTVPRLPSFGGTG
ncbi:MAG: Asp-tRNA(Asn)/Glu-tRNA(Gln) amidotransferase subunit GatC, partial [Gemmatimonadetes bacterium]|nr:Asp-tRNA(Asn)/Glu-tRNA(Gln) amidotransferase subunit GatC [Gemmatimonadota bacterium]NIQ54062.1 Asp-tRNA(Asn)/Glu-tRNA(Gln) amidotransferase subunit GatC [Gemmatimonadota bacterium]NIU74250.1 Asp-tRNA(Asn)/Glu-tRNA(Gln) amidotransferase subunit GatC [Gammaproteobacteria bacterium]NIX44272.1 Asp-tRNA(Asn)/Glu-tRNA(Gln) amidotransferase subunit GatC [Gemmatimonadota bacterium]NIY08486.1 Asp-tRNA(Asn)/Glu-tRNA(Gln) amidotransferase subunit GatC [Gemmatimonadota bacterium]